jgi:hypothetical protein
MLQSGVPAEKADRPSTDWREKKVSEYGGIVAAPL